MNTATTQKQVGQSPLRALDVWRLFEEFQEEAGLTQCPREEVIALFRRVMRAGIASVRESEKTVPFAHAVRASLEARKHRRPSTLADLRSYTGRMTRYGKWGNTPLRAITAHECRDMLAKVFGHSPHVFRKAQAILHSIFAYGRRQGWCDANPADAVERPPLHEQRIEILTPPQIKSLLRACDAPEFTTMAPSVKLMLWCGIRPGEVQRLRWKDIDAQEGVVYIDPCHSKTGGARAVPLRGAAKILTQAPEQEDGHIAPTNWARLWRRVRLRAGLRSWQQDALRHTFASLHLKYFHNPPQLQEEMGHRDSRLLRTRYLNMRNLSSSAAQRFFRGHGKRRSGPRPVTRPEPISP